MTTPRHLLPRHSFPSDSRLFWGLALLAAIRAILGLTFVGAVVLSSLAVADCRFVAAQILINEVLYDPEGSDSGREWVELLNVGPWPAPLEGLYLDFGNGSDDGEWREVWFGQSGFWLEPGVPFVIGERQDGEVDDEARLGLQNGPDALRLRKYDATLDLVGWGDGSPLGFFEGSPAATVPSGVSLARVDAVDRDDNRIDFTGRTPTPGRRNVALRDLRVQLHPPLGRAFPLAQSETSVSVRLALENLGVEDVDLTRWLPSINGNRVEMPSRSLAPGERLVLPVRARLDASADWAIVAAALDGPADEDLSSNRDTLRFARRPGPVRLTEIHPKPSEGDAEWIELRLDETVDLSGWWLEDSGGQKTRVDSTAPRPAGWEVLSETTDAATLPLQGWPSLNDRAGDSGVADSLFLFDAGGHLRDWAVYPGSSAGRSWIRLPNADSADPLDAWVLDDEHVGGTPGADAASPSPAPAESTWFSFHQHPEGLWVDLPGGSEGASLRVYDMSGRLLREVGRTVRGDRIRWDGRDGQGEAVSPGVYLLELEAESAVRRRTERRTVIVGP